MNYQNLSNQPNSQKELVDAYKNSFKETIMNLLGDLRKYKCCTIIITFFLSLLITTAIFKFLLDGKGYNLSQDYQDSYNQSLSTIMNFNIAIIGLSVACLAILFGLFQGKKFTEEAKDAVKEQSSSFILCAIYQIIALVLTLTIGNLDYVAILIFVQIWGLLIDFDTILELYSMTTGIVR